VEVVLVETTLAVVVAPVDLQLEHLQHPPEQLILLP